MPRPPAAAAISAERYLSDRDPVLAEVIARVGEGMPVLPAKVDLFQALMHSIIYQQLHGRAAAKIHERVAALMPGRIEAAALQVLSDESLRGAGLSANKLLAIRDLAAKVRDGTVPTARAAAKLSDEELLERLTAVRGIGPWTVHILMIFHLGRPDVMPTGDFAIRKAFSILYRRGRPVKSEAILRHAKRWSPYRSTASWYLWRSLDTVLPAPPSDP
jgi:3-methyladenine DNA glycosylase/8-oxoguanine DNA glycosylase